MECIQTDNDFEFTNRFSNSKRDLPTLFEASADKLGIHLKLIYPYTPVRWSVTTGRTRNDSIPLTAFTLWKTSQNSLLSTTAVQTTSQ